MKLIRFKYLYFEDYIFVNPKHVQAVYKCRREGAEKLDAAEMMIGGQPVPVAECLESVINLLQEVTP